MDIDVALRFLIGARASRIKQLPEHCRPTSNDEAYALQDAVARQLGPIEGWKVGAASPTAEPNCAPLLAGSVHPSPWTVPAQQSHMRGIEAEIAFRFAADLLPRDAPYSRDEVVTAVGAAMPAIEVCESRFENIRSVDALSLLADSNSNSALVFGADWMNWQDLDANAQPVHLVAANATIADQRGGNSAGEPVRLLVWLANHLSARGHGVKRDDVVTTGSWTGMQFAAPGDEVVARFDGVGSVTVRFEAEPT